jgi:hypothetical protein
MENITDNAQKQRKFKAKMYNAGFKQIQLWVKRKTKDINLDHETFVQKMTGLVSGMSEGKQSKLFNLLLRIAAAKKEASRKKTKQ